MMYKSVEIKNLKTFVGNEGNGFEAALYCDGVRVGLCGNSSTGGPNYYPSPQVEQKLVEFASAQPGIETGQYCEPADQYIGRLVDTLVVAKQAKSLFTKKICAVDLDGNIVTFSTAGLSAVQVDMRRSAMIVKGAAHYKVARFITSVNELAIELSK